jgi:transcription-repair coupling factor (superfamily II helicase)
MDYKSNFLSAIQSLSSLAYIDKLSTELNSNHQEIKIKHLVGSLGSLTIAGLWHKEKRCYLIVTFNIKEAEAWFHNLNLFFENKNIALLTPPKKAINYDTIELDQGLIWQIEGLDKISKDSNSIIITTPEIFGLKIPATNFLSESKLKLSRNDNLDFNELCKTLALNGFDRQEYVSKQGEIAIRGGIIDIFPIGWNNPLRLEFWDNDLESIREFETISQRSIKEHGTVEFISTIPNYEKDLFESSIIDYLPDNTRIVLDSPELLESTYPDSIIPDNFQRIIINQLGDADVIVKSQTQPNFHASVRELCNEIVTLCAMDSKIVLCAEGKIHTERFKDLVENLLFDNELSQIDYSNFACTEEKVRKSLIWLDETVTDGFILSDYKIAVFTEHQVFNRLRFQNKHTKKEALGISLQEVKQLNIGDYVVHVDKGIARFSGFAKVTMGGSLQDCIKLTFAEDDYLFVNLNYIQKIQKYSSQEGVQPKLSKLGSRDWERKKDRAKKRLKDIARDLIKLYAQRKMSPGFAFPADTIWQKEFEAAFIYEDTPDQAQTTSDTKKDMEENAPMDRLVCGDVGFGKTEIAIRAAFKAVQAGKQVAILVPTTILAQQHYLTFKDRFVQYPVLVDVISRFKTKKEQTEVVKRLSEGKIDILIGTHRLLSQDILFKDLGLLIIDEEHRFGVGAKEKLRQLRINIDTLTLTATPIPRTLNFSLMGARDLSIIETPPRNRLPVDTEITVWKDQKIQKAIMDEIERGGQVFFVSDKVHDLAKIMNQLIELMPTVKFGLAHGQMNNSELEKVMEKFIEGKYDVLITTKIVESGLDIPNANTMIINRANNFGLAELYQLRGRVGRSNTQAYCYLIIPPVKSIGTTALKRLHAIEEFTDLGSGFQLAMKDLEIRGAGNLLGPEQSGYIIEIGFELFHKILDDVVQELRREEFQDVFKDSEYITPRMFENNDIEIHIDTDALLPDTYIPSETDRFAVYKKLYLVKNNLELSDIINELKDRFGKIPAKVEELLFVVKVRIAALETGLVSIDIKRNKMTVEFPPETNHDFYQLAFQSISEIINEMKDCKFYQYKKKLLVDFTISNRNEAIEILWRIKHHIKALFD